MTRLTVSQLFFGTLLAVITLFFSVPILASYQCADLFLNVSKRLNSGIRSGFKNKLTNDSYTVQINTQTLIQYLTPLASSGFLTDNDLSRFLGNLKKRTLINPVPHTYSPHGILFREITYQVHFEAINNLIKRCYRKGVSEPMVDFDRLIAFVKEQSGEMAVTRTERSEAKKETDPLIYKMTFNEVAPGKFEMGGFYVKQYVYADKVEVEISVPFEMMTAPVTQWMWTMVMHYNPSGFHSDPKTGKHFTVRNKYGNEIPMQPNHPVERVSWKEIDVFIAQLNELARNNDPLIKKIIPDQSTHNLHELLRRN